MASDVELAWLAGLLEGDGCFTICSNHFGKYKIARISVAMYDEDVIEKAAKIMNCKINTHIILRGGEEKTVYRASLARKKDLKVLLYALLPYMGNRRSARIRELLAHMED